MQMEYAYKECKMLPQKYINVIWRRKQLKNRNMITQLSEETGIK